MKTIFLLLIVIFSLPAFSIDLKSLESIKWAYEVYPEGMKQLDCDKAVLLGSGYDGYSSSRPEHVPLKVEGHQCYLGATVFNSGKDMISKTFYCSPIERPQAKLVAGTVTCGVARPNDSEVVTVKIGKEKGYTVKFMCHF